MLVTAILGAVGLFTAIVLYFALNFVTDIFRK